MKKPIILVSEAITSTFLGFFTEDDREFAIAVIMALGEKWVGRVAGVPEEMPQLAVAAEFPWREVLSPWFEVSMRP